MKLSFSRLTTQEYPDVPESLLRAMNDLAAQLQAARAGASDLRGFQANVVFTASNAMAPVDIKNQLGAPPAGIIVLGATDTTTGQPAAVGAVAWSLFGDQIRFTGADGDLTVGHSYSLSLLVLGR